MDFPDKHFQTFFCLVSQILLLANSDQTTAAVLLFSGKVDFYGDKQIHFFPVWNLRQPIHFRIT